MALSDNEQAKRIRLFRALSFILLAAFMTFGPFYRQVLGGDNTVFRPWIMYKGKGVGIIDARFIQRLADGREIPINHFAELGYDNPRSAPAHLYKMKKRASLRHAQRSLCETHKGKTDIRVYARQMTRQGWREISNGSWNVCAT